MSWVPPTHMSYLIYKAECLFVCLSTIMYLYPFPHHWGYSEENGPDTWPETCLEGIRQSPIDIRASDVDFAYLDKMIFTNYDKTGPVSIRNNGHSVTVEGFEDWNENEPYIEGGGLKYRYRLAKFHFHWSQNAFGSEHAIGGLRYPGELHLVHFRDDLTESQAAATLGGIAVLGVFLLVGNDTTPTAAVSSALNDVIYPGNSTTIENFCLQSLLPENIDSFFRYDGSLTTPGCNEVVTWTVFAEPITIAPLQMKEFQEVHSDEETRLETNCRPVQPLNGRRILFRTSKGEDEHDNGRSASGAFSISVVTTLMYISLARALS
ncbi:unnamed protein product [Cylicocyclus nassatus]|uniref:Carbonic anhydrase n=1 Tax=Cylicocyclus nassatus TaxID=53992 RepID=A0AA36H666_CYLNA|nr:unnamed protein product [Cylicocyclus nassatus]